MHVNCAVGFDADAHAELLQKQDQIHDFGLDRGIADDGFPFGVNGCEQVFSVAPTEGKGESMIAPFSP